MLRQLSEPETRDLLASGRVGRLGCVFDDAPYVVPVSYIFHDDLVYIHSLLGRKIAALRANPKACLQVDEIRDEYQWRSAIAFGDYREVTDSGERDRAARELLERFPHLTPVESVPVHDGGSSVIVFCIQVKQLSGVGES
jgi:nitroimidazol reductase NimA-like FMN-containing flavoprotein (pyridoxamine 5'-phosphate oxidase superfamily)